MEEVKKGFFIKEIVIATIIALISSIVLILIFALLIKLFGISESAIKPTNIGIKTFSILLGIFVGQRSSVKVVLRGAIVGLLYCLISFLLFSALSGSFSFGNLKLVDILFAIAVGIIASIIKVAVKR